VIVLHNLRILNKNGIIEIPAFQAGHLGFIPGRSVHIYLLQENENPPAHCEVVVTPFGQIGATGNLLRLACVMKEGKGVVHRLLSALALLNVNVVAQESSTFHHQNYHYVSMVIDLSRSRLGKRTEPDQRTEVFYRRESAIAPLHQRRYIELFETIMAFCGDVFAYDDQDRFLPKFTMRLFDMDEGPAFPRQVSIGSIKCKNGRTNAAIKLDPEFIDTIKTNLTINTTDDLTYILVSETEYRKLRIIFPKPSQANHIFHVGFKHDDTPGALNAILNALSANSFSIVTSLHRTLSPGKSIWEAVLWYDGDKFPLRAGKKKRYEWLARKMSQNLRVEFLDDLYSRNVSVCVPNYPKPTIADSKIPPILIRRPTQRLTTTKQAQALTEKNRWNSRNIIVVKELERGIKLLKQANDEADWSAIQILERIKERRTNKKINIFISSTTYHIVNTHVENIKRAVEKEFPGFFFVDQFRRPEGYAETVKVVTDRIARCEGFIGIWHEDEEVPITGKEHSFGTSPWMPYEFGQAHSLGKECFIARSFKVHERFWRTITPGHIITPYNDANFLTEVVPQIITWLRINFVQNSFKYK
jgi:hypothetical protein